MFIKRLCFLCLAVLCSTAFSQEMRYLIRTSRKHSKVHRKLEDAIQEDPLWFNRMCEENGGRKLKTGPKPQCDQLDLSPVEELREASPSNSELDLLDDEDEEEEISNDESRSNDEINLLGLDSIFVRDKASISNDPTL